jgi:hypothetical protein
MKHITYLLVGSFIIINTIFLYIGMILLFTLYPDYFFTAAIAIGIIIGGYMLGATLLE